MATIPPGDSPTPSSAPAAPARPQQDLAENERRFRESEPYLRGAAASFGTDAERYDRARPTYPDAMIAAIAAAIPGPNVLDVGIGTGIAARLFKAHGCNVSVPKSTTARPKSPAAAGPTSRPRSSRTGTPRGELSTPSCPPRPDTGSTGSRCREGRSGAGSERPHRPVLERLPTSGGYTRLAPDQMERMLTRTGAAIDAMGGHFTMQYAAMVCTAVRNA
jgi:hypothetical protein